jgi:hypothetical protein
MHCVAAAAAAAAPDAPLVALLPQDAASPSGVAPGARAAVARALSADVAARSAPLFGAACDLLTEAVLHHPSLLDVLMFPADLEEAGAGGGGNKVRSRRRT